jgi:hypothetical protein
MGEVAAKAGRRVNIVQKMFTHVNAKRYLFKVFQELGREDKENKNK